MSILIKGMDMPKHCGECGIEWCERWKRLIVAGMPSAKARPEDCPIVPVPPHGRLIDADALWVGINKICDRRDAGIISDLTCLQQLLSAVRHAPTIIPAEEEKS